MSAYVYRGALTLAAEDAEQAATARARCRIDPDQLAIDVRNIARMICATQMRDVMSMRANSAHPRACCWICGALHRAADPCDVCALRAVKGPA